MKKDLLNSIEMLLSADLIDVQTYTELVRKASLFNEYLPELEAPSVRENEDSGKLCPKCGLSSSLICSNGKCLRCNVFEEDNT